jgi:dihydrofolate reductase
MRRILILRERYLYKQFYMISIIVAVSDDLGIGRKNDLLWHLPEDLKRFKKLTFGNTVIMGKKTWDSLPRRPLPGRKNVVITDIPHETFEGALSAYSIEDAMGKCEKSEEIFIIGGGSVYRQFMNFADRLYITHVHRKAEADVFFPEIDPGIWKVIEKEEYKPQDKEGIPYTYFIYERRKNV